MILSILIAAYNVEKYIEKCILSCYDEQYAAQYEIIVVNDGSTDATNQKIKEIQQIIPNLSVIHKNNEGLGAARNTGIENANGEYLWMVDGDDFLSPNILNIFFNNLYDLNKDVYAFNYHIVNEKGEILSIKYPSNFIDKELTGSQYYSLYFHNSYTWQYIFKKDIFAKSNLRFQERINMQDSEILPKIMFNTEFVLYVDQVAYNYVQQATSFTNSTNSTKRLQYFKSIIEVDQLLKEFGDSITIPENLIKSAINKKRKSLHCIVLNHLIFYQYDNSTFKEIITLLEINDFYPLKADEINVKMRALKLGFNINPVLFRKLIDFYIKRNQLKQN